MTSQYAIESVDVFKPYHLCVGSVCVFSTCWTFWHHTHMYNMSCIVHLFIIVLLLFKQHTPYILYPECLISYNISQISVSLSFSIVSSSSSLASTLQDVNYYSLPEACPILGQAWKLSGTFTPAWKALKEIQGVSWYYYGQH